MITIARISLAAIVVTITFGARAVSAQYAACTGCANLTDAAPVCGADGASYASECEAVFCGESLAVCSGECPCTDGEDPATDSCSDVTFARTGHQYGPEGAYAAMADVAWPAACCAHCDMDADCVSYTWASMYFDGTPTCYLYATPVEPTKPGTAYPYCFSGNKLPADYASGMDMPEYWRAMAISSGNDPMRMGFSGDSNQWFLDGMASCVGWGEYNDVCASDELVCAADKLTNTCYGFGSEQMDVIHDLFHWNIDRHYQCPGCFYPEQDGEVMACVAHGAPAYMPAGVPEMFGLALPGSVSPHNPGNFVDCGCVEYHMESPFDDLAGSYTRLPVTNAWHHVEIAIQNATSATWSNAANREWELKISSTGALIAPASPYGYQALTVDRDGAGRATGVYFLNELYEASPLRHLAGRYTRLPVTNGWHHVEITVQSGSEATWTNLVRDWGLEVDTDAASGVLEVAAPTALGNPYAQTEVPLQKDASGTVTGVKFLGELYQLSPLSGLAGTYTRLPVENDWHRVTITDDDINEATWSNDAGVSWGLEIDATSGALIAPSSPYGAQTLQVTRNARGDVTAVVFQGENYYA